MSPARWVAAAVAVSALAVADVPRAVAPSASASPRGDIRLAAEADRNAQKGRAESASSASSLVSS